MVIESDDERVGRLFNAFFGASTNCSMADMYEAAINYTAVLLAVKARHGGDLEADIRQLPVHVSAAIDMNEEAIDIVAARIRRAN